MQHIENGKTLLPCRREMLAYSIAALMSPHVSLADDEGESAQLDGCSLGFSTYGMKSLTTEVAINILSEIGFDAVEVAVRSGWDADSKTLSRQRRVSLRKLIEQSSLRLSSLMEHVYVTDDRQQIIALERLKLASEVAHDLSPDAPPLVQTVLGSGNFELQKNQVCDRLGEWVRLADLTDTTIAIKPHRGGIISRPDEAVWLIEQLGKPSRLRMVYDYSHYVFRDMEMAQTIVTALPYTSHIAVKDAVQEGDRVVFELPGDSNTIDFSRLIRRFFAGGYRGDINCEVSGMVSSKPGYDPIAAAKTCYRNMSNAFELSGVARTI